MQAMLGENFHIRKPNRFARKRKPHLTKHHDKAKSLGGTYDTWNIFKLSEEHHQAYHKLFGLRTFDQAATVLLRMKELHRTLAA